MCLVIAQSEGNAQIDHEVFRARLKLAAGGPLNAWLDTIGVRNTVYSALSRDAVPGADTLVKISVASGRSIDWLIGLRDDDTTQGVASAYLRRAVNQSPSHPSDGDTDSGLGSEFVYVNRYDVRASGGNGWFTSEENVVGRYAYQRDWWERNIKAAPADCAIIDCDGRSMEPDINDGDPILIHLKDCGLNADAVYVFRLGERLLVKRLQLLPHGKINVISSNKDDYPPYQIDQAALQSPETGSVIARVFGIPGGFRWIR